VDCVDLENSDDEDSDEIERSCFLVSVESKLIQKGFSSLVAEIQVNINSTGIGKPVPVPVAVFSCPSSPG
jgi:hypothetical protein